MKPGTRLSLALLVAMLGSGPALAQSPSPSASPPPPPPAAAQQEEDEVIVTGRRPVMPSMMEELEYHNQEYRRLKQIYDPDPPPIPRADKLVRIPESISQTIQGRPTLPDKY
ncbi:hypothetical protein HHL28_08880 [Aerophototrophica crusticola]|uniref:Uncharacterized protein n=1 Tax=Aerophototrophica crusticola TaxID=1709002 RepID=A0A858R843_9PROT|nr:hypothetical protein HHL28_08880 [Rhodospirillaceae bacterium B3]